MKIEKTDQNNSREGAKGTYGNAYKGRDENKTHSKLYVFPNNISLSDLSFFKLSVYSDTFGI